MVWRGANSREPLTEPASTGCMYRCSAGSGDVGVSTGIKICDVLIPRQDPEQHWKEQGTLIRGNGMDKRVETNHLPTLFRGCTKSNDNTTSAVNPKNQSYLSELRCSPYPAKNFDTRVRVYFGSA